MAKSVLTRPFFSQMFPKGSKFLLRFPGFTRMFGRIFLQFARFSRPFLGRFSVSCGTFRYLRILNTELCALRRLGCSLSIFLHTA